MQKGYNITPEMLAKWHQERFTPQNTILGITGDVKAADLVPKLEKALAAWKKTDLTEVLPPNPKQVASKKVLIVDRPGSVQTTVAPDSPSAAAMPRPAPRVAPARTATRPRSACGSGSQAISGQDRSQWRSHEGQIPWSCSSARSTWPGAVPDRFLSIAYATPFK